MKQKPLTQPSPIEGSKTQLRAPARNFLRGFLWKTGKTVWLIVLLMTTAFLVLSCQQTPKSGTASVLDAKTDKKMGLALPTLRPTAEKAKKHLEEIEQIEEGQEKRDLSRTVTEGAKESTKTTV